MTKKGPACRQAGFTLVELLVAIGIIATLAAILLPNLMGARERARDAQRKQDLDSVKSALRLYYNDHGEYPFDPPIPAAATYNPDGQVLLSGYLSTYMPNLENIGFEFDYWVSGDRDKFRLRVVTEAGRTEDNLASQAKCGETLAADPTYYMICAN
jgi:prepilin-type N-terminal cleavage/methylation domain-containing protein